MKMWQTRCLGVILADLDGSEVLVKLRVQRGQLIDGAVESAMVVTQDLTEEEGGKRDIHNNALSIQKWQLHIHWRLHKTLCSEWVQQISTFPQKAQIYLVYGFPKHLPHKLEQVQMVLMDVRRRWRIQPFISTSSLWKYIISYKSVKSMSAAEVWWLKQQLSICLTYLEQVESRIEHFLNDFL